METLFPIGFNGSSVGTFLVVLNGSITAEIAGLGTMIYPGLNGWIGFTDWIVLQ